MFDAILYKKFLQIISKLFNNFSLKKSRQECKKIIFDLSSETPKLLYLHHEWGGGVDFWLQNQIQKLKNDNCICVIFYQKKLNKINLQVIFKEQRTSASFNNFAEIADIFSKIEIGKIYVNQISFFPNIDTVFEFIKQNRSNKTKTIMLMHDFSSICINGNLIKDDGSKCGIAANKNSCDCNLDSGKNVKKWESFLTDQADEILCFSEHSHRIVSQFYPSLIHKISVIPHDVPFLRMVNVVKSDQTINIAVIGFLNKIKGCDIVEEMSQLIIANNLPIRIFVAGKCKVKGNSVLKILGKYKREDLPEIIEQNQIDAVFISSICPETFSYTTNEALMMGLKVICFDIGAQAECVRKYSQGCVIEKVKAKEALDTILNFVKQ